MLLDAVTREWQKSLDTGEPFHMEFPLRGADGELRWFLTRVVPQYDRQGRLVRWFGPNVDIDDMRVARALAEEMAEQSRHTAERLVELTARIATLEADNERPRG